MSIINAFLIIAGKVNIETFDEPINIFIMTGISTFTFVYCSVRKLDNAFKDTINNGLYERLFLH